MEQLGESAELKQDQLFDKNVDAAGPHSSEGHHGPRDEPPEGISRCS